MAMPSSLPESKPAVPGGPAVIRVNRLEKMRPADLHDLSDAAEAAILEDGGFGWIEPPGRELMERFWRGVALIPERRLFVGRVDGVVAGSVQLVHPPRNNEAQGHAATLTTCFVAPWARGHGLGRLMVASVEEEARVSGFSILNLDLRATQTRAIALFESLGFRRWGTHPYYARVRGETVAGFYYFKQIVPDSPPAAGTAP